MPFIELDDLNSNIADHDEDIIDTANVDGDGNPIIDAPEQIIIDENLDNKTDETITESETVITDEDTSNLSGIEQYLSQFSIEGGMIDFQDGSRVHFNDLDNKKQFEVLTKLHESSTQGVEEKFGLDEDEIGLINYLRQNEGTVDEIIDRLAQQRAQTYITAQEIKTTDVSKMDADAVYTTFLLKTNPEATVEQLEEDLNAAKKMVNFNNIVTSLKNGMLKEQANLLAEQQNESAQATYEEIENQRRQVIDVVSKTSTIDGLTLNDGIKNDVLDLILNVDDDGDSLFMTEVFSDPGKLFKAAFWYKNGADIISSREEYWKKEKSAAYKRGQLDAQTGKKSFSSTDVKDRNATTPHRSDPTEIVSFDDLY